MSALARRNLLAAVIEANDPVAADSARVVPEGARKVKVGAAVLGYRKRRGRGSIATIRLREIERIISLRYGPGGCDTDDGGAYAILAGHCLIPRLLERHAGRADVLTMVVDRFTAWCTRYVPELDPGEVVRIAGSAFREPRQFRADSAARLIRLTMAERTAARVSTVGAIDCDAAGRKELSREAHRVRSREHMAEKRRAAGARTREEVQANSVAARCRAMGISRATYYRRLKAGQIEAEAPRDTSVAAHNKGNHGEKRECLIPPAAKPQPPSRREPFRYYPAPSARPAVPEPEPAGRRASLVARRDAPPGRDIPGEMSDRLYRLTYLRAFTGALS